MNLHLRPLHRWDLAACAMVNRAHRYACCRRFFAAVSRAGDGAVWYALMAVLPLIHGRCDLLLSAQLALNGALCTAIYKALKHATRRPRPCDAEPRLLRSVPPLDRFSFPSGHTLHAVAFTLLTTLHHPAWGWILAPFTALVAVSRLVLGLHYPSDVFAGALLGAAVTTASAAWWGT